VTLPPLLPALSLVFFTACGQAEHGADLEPEPATAVKSLSQPGDGPALEAARGPSFNLLAGVVRWLAIGGGSSPSLNQVSIEADLGLAQKVFGPGGYTLFAGGPGASGVQVKDAARRGDPLVNLLGDIFAPRAGRDTHYRRTTLTPNGPATGPRVFDALAKALAQDTKTPLTLFVSAHGDQGKVADDNAVLLWGGYDLRPPDIAKELARKPTGRPLQLVMTSCFSGGFAEVIFKDAVSERGAPPGPPRACGLFAAPWDRESTGCDPDPVRRHHDGYGLHFLQALKGLDKLGKPLPDGGDLDRDGKVSLLEAHTRVRVAGKGMDLPTTTSERWLRYVNPPVGPEAEVALPEEEAVIAALKRRLKVSDPTEKLAARKASIAMMERRYKQATRAEQDTYLDVAGELLARWPVLDDAWHPDFAPTVAAERQAILAFFKTSKAYRRHLSARSVVDEIGRELDAAQVDTATWERLARALKTRLLARRLKAKGGPDWERYAALLACERSPPPGTR